jgi:ribosomal protein L11 methyltransferase
MASGTGEHPCTQLALQAIEDYIRPRSRVLDVGTGSGILAITAQHLGAGFVCGFDTDANALTTARENFRLNGLTPGLIAGSTECLRGAWADLVVANISGTVLLALFDELLRVLRPSGRLILSGFTEGELDTFRQLLPGAEVTALNEWRCVSGQISSLVPVP